MTVFRQENLEEHYETGEDLGRWVRAGGGAGRREPSPLSAAGQGARAGAAAACRLRWPHVAFLPPLRCPATGRAVGFQAAACLPFLVRA